MIKLQWIKSHEIIINLRLLTSLLSLINLEREWSLNQWVEILNKCSLTLLLLLLNAHLTNRILRGLAKQDKMNGYSSKLKLLNMIIRRSSVIFLMTLMNGLAIWMKSKILLINLSKLIKKMRAKTLSEVILLARNPITSEIWIIYQVPEVLDNRDE